MDIIPRLFGIGTYIVSFMFIYSLILRLKVKTSKKILILYLLILTMMGYFFIPPDGFDLYRIKGYVHSYSFIPIESFIDLVLESNVPGQLSYYYFLSQLNDDGWIAGLTVLITFYNLFSILWKGEKRFSATKKSIAFTVFFIAATGIFGTTIDNIRTMLAFSFIAKCYYEEVYEGKSLIQSIPFYLIAISLHLAALVAVALRFFVLLIEGQGGKYKKIFNTIVLILSVICFVVYGEKIIDKTVEKAINYITGDAYSYFWNVLHNSIMTFLVLYICKNVAVYFRDDNNIVYLKSNIKFVLVLFFVIVAFAPFDYSIAHRFSLLLAMISLPLIINYANYIGDIGKDNSSVKMVLFILLIIACTRGNVCSLKYWQ